MKSNKMNRVVLFLIVVMPIVGFAQTNEGLNCWNFGYGKSGTPGDYLLIGLEKSVSKKGAYYGQAGYEFSHYSGLQYSMLSLSLGYHYYVYGSSEPSPKRKINIVIGAGGVGQIEWETNLYKDFSLSSRCNYGLFGQAVGEYSFDRTIGFFVSGEQKYQFNKLLGKTNYNILFGLRIHFGGEIE